MQNEINYNELSIKLLNCDEIIPYHNNPRKYSKSAIDKVKASIKEYGFRQPIVVDSKNVIVVGHVLFAAARALGLESVPVHVASELTPLQIKAYRLADNRTNEESSWDDELLTLELLGLEENKIDLRIIGFEVDELDRLLADNNYEASNEDVLQIPIRPITKVGDIWQMDQHRLVCGDSTIIADYQKLLGGELVELLCTDPPYNVNYEGKAGKILNDQMDNDSFFNFLHLAFQCAAKNMKDGASTYVFYGEKETENFYKALRMNGLQQSSCLIWQKNHFVMGRSDYQPQHEPIWYGWKSGAKHVWHGGRKQKTIQAAIEELPITRISESEYAIRVVDKVFVVTGENLNIECLEGGLLRYDRPLVSDLHPTIKPISLIERLIKNSSNRGGLVMDIFAGSGTTLIACENTNRIGRAMELDPKFCDVIVERWQKHTGKCAINATTGKTFSEVKHG